MKSACRHVQTIKVSCGIYINWTIRETLNAFCYVRCWIKVSQKGAAEVAIHAAMRSFNYRIKHAQIGWEVVKDGGYPIITFLSPFPQLHPSCQLCLQPVPKADPARKHLSILQYVFKTMDFVKEDILHNVYSHAFFLLFLQYEAMIKGNNDTQYHYQR